MTSDAERYARLHSIVGDARDMPPDRLAPFLDEACGDDPSMRVEVQQLLELATDEDTNHAFAEAHVRGARLALEGAIADATAPSWLPEQIGGYRIVRQIGRGGMGVVYEAEQESPRRKVALKLMHPMQTTPDTLRRFHRETELLGRLAHPGIAQIFEASTYDVGNGPQPFFAMELVEGVPLTDFAEANAIDVAGRLELIARLCDVLDFAHQRGVIHRDLKPANILVVAKESSTHRGSVVRGEAGLARLKVLDFGVARAIDADPLTTTLQTTEGQLVGTVSYMSPEQASGNPAALDTRSDVYAVGVLAYQLLSGHLPHRTNGMHLQDALRAIRDENPSALGTFDRSLRGDIETIVAKALRKEKDGRYASAAELAADIRRHLSHQPIEARPPSALYQLRKFVSRHKAMVGGVAATLVVAVVGAVVATVFALDATKRATELSEVAKFQSAQLGGINVERMGSHLHDSLLEQSRAAMQRAGVEEEELAGRMQTLETMIEGTSFVDMALQALNENIFATAAAAAEEQFAAQPLLQARLLQTLADTQAKLGLRESALTAQCRALELRRQELGDDHVDTLASLYGLGWLRFAAGMNAEAEALFREVLAGRRRVHADNHLQIRTVLDILSYLLVLEGRIEEFLPLRREFVELTEGAYGRDAPVALQARSSLLSEEGKHAQAASLLRKALDLNRSENGEQHPLTIHLKRSLAEKLFELGRLEESESLFRETLAERRREFGESNPLSLETMMFLGDVLRSRGKLAEAELLLREALATQQRRLGEQNPDTLATSRALDRLLEAQDTQ